MPALDSTLPVTDLTAPVMYSDPFPHFARLRAEAPVSMATAPLVRGKAYMAVTYDDVMAVHTDKRFSSDMIANAPSALTRRLPRIFRVLTDSMVFKDDPEHKRLRGLVNKAFTPKRVAAMSEDITRIADALVDDLVREAPTTVDIVERLATPLPLSVIASMLGVGAGDRDRFHHDVVRSTEGFAKGGLGLLRGMPASRRLIQLFDKLAAQGRSHPDEGLITALVQASEGDDHLGDDEIVAMIYLLLLAGHDTTSNLVGNGLLSLLDHPDQLERLRAEPDLIDSAVEELLRYTSPVPFGTTRYALEDVELSGVAIPKGSQVLAMIISANRDEHVFDRPEELDLGREGNRHIAFAFGAHYCLGNQLARLEARAAIGALVRRFDGIELAIDRSAVRYKPTPTLRGPVTLPLRLHPASVAA